MLFESRLTSGDEVITANIKRPPSPVEAMCVDEFTLFFSPITLEGLFLPSLFFRHR